MKNDELPFKIIPYLTGFFILVSLFKAMAYYAVFEIRIVDYLRLQEVLILFIDDLLMITVVISLVAFVSLTEDFDKDGTPRPPANVKKRRNLTALQGLLLIVFSQLCYFYMFPSDVAFVLLGTTMVIAIIMVFVFGALFRYEKIYERQNNEPLNKYYRSFVMYGLFYIFIAISFGTSGAFIKKNSPEQADQYVIELKSGSTIVTTDSTILYVGRTHNYIFLYDLVTKEKSILPDSEIASLSIKTKWWAGAIKKGRLQK